MQTDKIKRECAALFHSGQSVGAIARLDNLLSYYARQRQVNAIVRTLEHFVSQYPDEIALRQRLVAIYTKMGDKRRALDQLDVLGEQQLDAGLQRDAANTIRRIMDLRTDGNDTNDFDWGVETDNDDGKDDE